MGKSVLLAATMLACATPLAAQPVPTSPATAAPAQQQQQQRPNVLVWMLDDVGFAQLSCFGGLVSTPNIDRVAKLGLRYNNYHTAPVCSAARAAFLTGRMPHSVGLGNHAATARPYPGYNGNVPAWAGTIADNLHAAGYATTALGKWDHLPNEEATPAGPFHHWPSGQGFEHFYGFLSADTDNWHPTLIRDQSPVLTPKQPGYHLNRDLADEAIAGIATRAATASPRPFFVYWATSTAHAPHHAPADWIARYKGKFDMGWDKAREAILKAEKAGGLVPKNAKLAQRPPSVPAWDSLSADQKRLYARQMEVFAASLSYADAQFGRILDTLEASGELDNTLVVVTSDNGASAEGNHSGMFTEAYLGRGRAATLEENLPFYERWGGPESYPHYAMGWAVAGNTPFRYFKHTTHEGGTRVPLIMAWPKGIAARGELRSQFVHVSDVTPTIMEMAGVPLAETVHNVAQRPMDGTSFAYSLADAKAPVRKGPQYVEMYGNKGLWADGWSINTSHRLEPWDMATMRPITAPWELYDLTRDPGQNRDLAARYPQRVAAMDQLFSEQAARYQVNPIGNIGEGMAEGGRKARADFSARGGVWRYAGPVSNIAGPVGPPVSALGFTMRARLDLPSGNVTGPVFAIGGHLGGEALYLKQGKPVFTLNTTAGENTSIMASEALPAGVTELQLRFDRPKGSDAAVTISAGGRVLASGTVSAAALQALSVTELFGLGIDSGTAVLPGAEPDVRFPGQISDVTFDFTARP